MKQKMHMVNDKIASSALGTGTKRKFELITETRANPSLSTNAKKWSCTLCKVNTKCEYQLKSHLNGKNHKAKESALIRAQIDSTMYRDTKNLGQPQSTNLTEKATDMDLVQPPWTNASMGPSVVELVQNKFRCKICNFDATSESEMNAHKMGNAHLRLFMENGGYLTDIIPMFDDMIL